MKARETEDESPLVKKGRGKDDLEEVREMPEGGGRSTGKHHVEVGGAEPHKPIVEKALDNGDAGTAANQLYNLLGLAKQSSSIVSSLS